MSSTTQDISQYSYDSDSARDKTTQQIDYKYKVHLSMRILAIAGRKVKTTGTPRDTNNCGGKALETEYNQLSLVNVINSQSYRVVLNH